MTSSRFVNDLAWYKIYNLLRRL